MTSTTSSDSTHLAAPAITRRKLVAGNWKMFGSRASNARLLRTLAKARVRCDWLVCVPSPYLLSCRDLLRGSRIGLGAQNCALHAQGAYTGEVSAAMLLDCGARWVIVGHSERRQLFGEDDACVAAKTVRALASGLKVIVCLGETLQEREANQTEAVLLRQWDAVYHALSQARQAATEMPSLPRDAATLAQQLVIAYEPVWAIGTGRAATPEQAEAVHALLRRHIAQQADWGEAAAQRLRILYGGSVKPANAAAFFTQPDIDGGLIGGASLVAEDFLTIAKAAG